MAISSWKEKITEALKRNKEGWGDIRAIEIVFNSYYKEELEIFHST